jgi:hypothetical protein
VTFSSEGGHLTESLTMYYGHTTMNLFNKISMYSDLHWLADVTIKGAIASEGLLSEN